MLEILITAIGLGLFLSFSLGPVFFELINTSLRKGFRTAFAMEIGVVFSDILYLFLALFSAAKAIEYLNEFPRIKYVFGFIFILFGLYSIVKNLKPSEIDVDTLLDNSKEVSTDESSTKLSKQGKSKTGYYANMAKGFGMNAVNPSVLIFWILICSTSIQTLRLDNQGILIFFSITIGAMFLIDITKIYFASKLKKFITPRSLQIINIIVGAIMIGVGFYFMLVGFDIPQEAPMMEIE